MAIPRNNDPHVREFRATQRVYFDDLIAFSATWESHLQLLEDIFKTVQAADLILKPSKIQFGPKEVKHLGYILSAHG